MAAAVTVPEEQLVALAGKLVTLAKFSFPVGRVSLGETFELHRLDGIVSHEHDTFSERVTFTGAHHHQLFVNDAPAGYVITTGNLTDGPLDAIKVVATTIAADVDRAIDLIDQEIHADVPVCLVTAPAYLVTALWVRDPNEPLIMIAARPAWFSELRPLVFLTPPAFMAILAREQASGSLDVSRTTLADFSTATRTVRGFGGPPVGGDQCRSWRARSVRERIYNSIAHWAKEPVNSLKPTTQVGALAKGTPWGPGQQADLVKATNLQKPFEPFQSQMAPPSRVIAASTTIAQWEFLVWDLQTPRTPCFGIA